MQEREARKTRKEHTPTPIEPIFALDIGTRSIMGVVGVPEGDLLRVLAVEEMEHTKRAMIDGQIEDIEQTARIAAQVKARLEQRIGCSLTHVSVAAAGRALRTQKAQMEIELDAKAPITGGVVADLEMAAIEQARAAVMSGQEGDEPVLQCVGYSVIRYYLDDYALSTLIGHRGNRARVEIIATFLPSEVVESLYAAMAKTKLTVASITLEPIAAMNAIVPQELRMLNLALVDIGAGTSDIAISNDGSVVAYTMATVAGDEITEAIMREYLVDFQMAEQMKHELGKGGRGIVFTDILGFRHDIAPEEMFEKITPAIDSLCEVISQNIVDANGKAPAAVFLVGGGSQAPMMRQMLARHLGIGEDKVAVGGNNYMKRMLVSEQDVSSPQYATPIGIALTALSMRERDGVAVTVNGQSLHMFKHGTMNVMDVLLMAGYRHSQIIGRSGKSVTVELNGKRKVIRGEHPQAAQLTVNGRPASISTPVRSGDVLDIKEAVAGTDAAPYLRDLAGEWKTFSVSLNGAPVSAGTAAIVNGAQAAPDLRLQDLDVVELYEIETIADLCKQARLRTDDYRFLVNGQERSVDYKLQPGDDIRCFAASATLPSPQPEMVEAAAAAKAAPAAAVMAEPAPQNDKLSAQPPISIRLNGRQVELYPKPDGAPYLFVDMLNFVDIDPSKPQGNIHLGINGREASYLDPVQQGDVIDIYWEKPHN